MNQPLGIFKIKLENLWNSLTEIQKSDLWSLWDNGILSDEMFTDMIDSIIKMEEE